MASHTNTGIKKYMKTAIHKFVHSFKLFLGGFGNDCNGLQEYMMLLGSFVDCLLSLWVRGAPTRCILGAFGASLGSLGLPSVAFGGPLGCLWGFICSIWESIGVPLGGHLGALGLSAIVVSISRFVGFFLSPNHIFYDRKRRSLSSATNARRCE